jgi:hypothetical protein
MRCIEVSFVCWSIPLLLWTMATGFKMFLLAAVICIAGVGGLGVFFTLCQLYEYTHAEFGSRRIRDTPVAEAAMIGLGVGAAGVFTVSGTNTYVEFSVKPL